MKLKIKAAASVLMGILTLGALIAGCSFFKNGGDVNISVEPQFNTTVKK